MPEAMRVSSPSLAPDVCIQQLGESGVPRRRHFIAGLGRVDAYAFAIDKSASSARRLSACAVTSAARVRLTTLTTICASCFARGARS